MNEIDESIFRSLQRLETIGKDVHHARTRMEMELANNYMEKGTPHEMNNWLELLRRVDQDVNTTKMDLATHLYSIGSMDDNSRFWQASPEIKKHEMNLLKTERKRYASSPYRRTTSHLIRDLNIRYIEPDFSINDEGKEIVCRIELPGVKREELELYVSEGRLLLSAEPKTVPGQRQKTKQYYAELELPTSVATNNVQARLDSGVLEVKLKKLDPTSGYSKVSIK